MPRYIAFLRAVNVGGASTIKMDVLRHAFEGFGFSNVATFIASGNIIFDAAAQNTGRLENKIERGLLSALGREITPFVRTSRELTEIVAFNPFPESPLNAGDQLAVVFLQAPPGAKAMRTLETFNSNTDEFRPHARQIYWLRHLHTEGSAYSTVPLDQALSGPFTIRTMSTLRKIAEKYFLDE